MSDTDLSASARIRRSEERGFEDFGWTDNWMTFSFANYYDPDWIHFGPIRVIVENHIQPHEGFDSHPHRDMEIVTYVSSGVLTHKDSMGNEGGIHEGEVQRMTAGSGIVHSEMNEHDEVEHNIQIWILPDRRNIEPGYKQLRYSREERTGRLRLYISPDGRDDSLTINQDAEIYAGILQNGDRYSHLLEEGRGAWIQVVHGGVTVNEELVLEQGDGAGITDPGALQFEPNDSEGAELILFDVAMQFKTPYNLG